MLKVEMTGLLFNVAQALTQANIPFGLVKEQNKWAVALNSPVARLQRWTISEVHDDMLLVHCGETYIVDLIKGQDPLRELAHAACFFIESDEGPYDNDPAWLQVFLMYGFVKYDAVPQYVRNKETTK